ncbi:phage tail protein [Vibrio splendidus]|uniref:phage tail-collar fiber domain-containing protein n=1 Tax=Vibrio TaxID=662 RepID=UPI0024697528|nr:MULTISPECIES: phage tail protein [Vibrio]MDH5938578.1 phage tail protein [Vibrio splendidus]MDH5967422.1 phage tail protein [Vibrio aestuarianus]
MVNTDTDLRCYLTNAGIAAENNAIQLGRKLPIKEMVFGSGVLADSEDPRNQTTMISEQFKVPCAMITHSDNTTLLTFKGDIPVDVGGFNINEVAIRLEDGTIYGYARGTGDYKPTPEQGATESIRYVVDMYSTNVTVIECKVDLSNVYADYEDLEKSRAECLGALENHSKAPDPHPQYHKNGDHGVGASNGLRGTIYELGTPEQLFGTGFVCGIARGGPDGVGIPQIAHDDFYGTLISNFQYGDSTGSGACNRMFISRFGMFVQTVAEENWVEWRQIYDNKTLPSLSKQGSQFALYDSERVYLPYETCITVSDGKVSIWEAYSNLPFSGKNPSDSQNRPEGWIDPDPNKPFYWIPHHMYLPGETIQIGTTNREEWMLPAHATLLNKNKYWRIAERHPEWLHSDGVNLLPPDERGLHLRNIDDGSGVVPDGLLVNETHVDQNRQHSHFANAGAEGEGGFDGELINSSSWTMRYTTPYKKQGSGSAGSSLSNDGGAEVRVKSIGKYAVRAI